MNLAELTAWHWWGFAGIWLVCCGILGALIVLSFKNRNN